MAESDFGNPTPQFGTAEYAPKPGTDVCKSCQQTISGPYYRVSGSLACAQCAEQLKNQIPKDHHAVFVRGLAFGIGGAILGLILYSTFSIVTGLEIGYVSLAVGWIIAKAIMMGSKGVGGRRYQIAAALLTYGAVSMAAVPIYFSQINKEKPAKPSQAQTSPSGEPAPAPSDQNSAASGAEAASQPSSAGKPGMNLAKALGLLVFVGLASPFLELQNPLNGALGLLILFIGMNIAWRLTAGPKIDILGPFTAGTSPVPQSGT
jgi:predicted lipid-binding transport protein (Tim44 family)